jgi:hypothetical protein
VTVITAGKAGGSGEIAVNWDAVSAATGYRVDRSTTPSGPFSVGADLNVVTGKTIVAKGVTNVWSDTQNFYPFARVSGAPPSRHFHYVEVDLAGTHRGYFRVVAYNAAGAGTPSVVVCGAPIGYPQC